MTLDPKLDEYKSRAQDAEEKAMKERKKRKMAEEVVESLKSQIAAMGEAKESKTNNIVKENAISESRRQINRRHEITKLRIAIEERNHTIELLRKELENKESI